MLYEVITQYLERDPRLLHGAHKLGDVAWRLGPIADIIESALDLFRHAGYESVKQSGESRRLVFVCPEIGITFLIVRSSDVPTYVEYGGADAGIVGKDVLMEQESDVYEPLDLVV